MKKYCYADGKIVDITKAILPVTDLAVMRGYAVFDFLRVYNGQPFCLKDHFKRFRNSAKLLGLTVPVSLENLEKIIDDLLKKNKARDVSVRLFLSGGESADGITLEKGQSKFFVLMADHHNLPEEIFTKGGKLITHEYLRVVPGAKNTNYISAVLARPLMKKAGAVEVLYTHEGKVLECSTSNFFIVKGNKVITPSDGVLGGVTKKMIIKLAKKKYEVEERAVLVSEIASADEAFITATNKFAVPIVKIDEQVVGDGQVGQVSKYLLEAYKKEIAKLS